MKSLGVGTLIILILATTALIDAETGVGKWLELRRGLERSEARVARLLAENSSLSSEIQVLEGDPAAIERVIREELDQALPGEVIIRFEPASDPLPGMVDNSNG